MKDKNSLLKFWCLEIRLVRAWGPRGYPQGCPGEQGSYNTVRVMYCIVPIQYCNVMYCIPNFLDKVLFVHRSYVPRICSYSVLVYNLQLFAKIIFCLNFLFFFLILCVLYLFNLVDDIISDVNDDVISDILL